MAQILKESVKEQIIESATNELLNYGYKDSSMRRIATNAKMTVGNLYRYFKNKDEMISFIINPTFERINDILSSLTNNGVIIGNNDIDVSILENEQIINILDQLAVELVKIYQENQAVMQIVLMHTSVNDYIKNWFSNLIMKLFEKKHLLVDEKSKRKCHALSVAYSASIFEGVRECFLNKELNYGELTDVIKLYFRSFIAFMNTQMEI